VRVSELFTDLNPLLYTRAGKTTNPFVCDGGVTSPLGVLHELEEQQYGLKREDLRNAGGGVAILARKMKYVGLSATTPEHVREEI